MKGRAEGDQEELQRAVELCREALAAVSRETDEFSWAEKQSNLGFALASLGALSDDLAQLNQARKAYEQALEIRKADKSPLGRAIVLEWLGDVLLLIGKKKKNREEIVEAVAAQREALAAFETAEAIFYVMRIRKSLDQSQTALAQFDD